MVWVFHLRSNDKKVHLPLRYPNKGQSLTNYSLMAAYCGTNRPGLPTIMVRQSSFGFLLLLHSQLYLWSSPFWVRFLRMWPFFKPTIEVVIFHLRGWCMLDVFLLPAFTLLGHGCQGLLSLCDVMHVCTE